MLFAFQDSFKWQGKHYQTELKTKKHRRLMSNIVLSISEILKLETVKAHFL